MNAERQKGLSHEEKRETALIFFKGALTAPCSNTNRPSKARLAPTVLLYPDAIEYDS